MIRLIFAISLCFIVGCERTPIRIRYPLEEKTVLAHMVQKKAQLQLESERGLILVGTGGGMMDEIRMLALSFEYDKPMSPCEGRKLLIRAVDVFLAIINENEEIRPYLIQSPFKPEYVEIRIFLNNPNGTEIPLGDLSILSAVDGVLNYLIEDPVTTLFVTAYKETYQEAVAKLAVNSLEPQKLIAPPPKNFFDGPGARPGRFN